MPDTDDTTATTAPGERRGRAPLPASNWGPTRRSLALALLVCVPLAVALPLALGLRVPVLVALADATLFGACLWLVGRDRWRVPAVAVASVLALLVGVGFALAVGLAALGLTASIFPVPSQEAVPEAGLRLVSATLVVVGSTVALAGSAASVGRSLRAETLRTYFEVASRVAVVPFLLAGLMATGALLSNLGPGADGAAVTSPAARVGAVASPVLSPPAGATHLFSLSLLALVATAATERAVASLPLAELTPERDADGVTLADAADVLDRALTRLAAAFAALTALGVLELAVPPAAVAGALGDGAYALLVAATTTPLPRLALAALLLAALAVLAVTATLRWLARTPTGDVAAGLTPFLAGAGVVAVALAVQAPVVEWLLSFVADHLPPKLAAVYARQAGAVVEFYGVGTVVLSLAALALGLTAGLSGSLWTVLETGYLPRSVAGPALAAAGLFLAAAFAGAAGVGAPLVLAGVAGSLLVWDLGAFAVTLGEELGRRAPTGGVELAHAGGSAAVGVGGAVAAAGLLAVAPGVGVAEVSVVPLALVAVVAALLFFVLALR